MMEMGQHILQIQPVSLVGMSTQILTSLADAAMIMAGTRVTVTINRFQ
jgi:hypothetical protein